MKKIILLFLILFTSIPFYGEVLKFKTTLFSKNKYNYYTEQWSGWEDWQSSDMLLVIDTDNSTIIVYSPTIQIYKIYEVKESHYDSDGDLHVPFKFIDQDGDRGTVKLLQRQSGESEVYIEFANIKWCYRVIRL